MSRTLFALTLLLFLFVPFAHAATELPASGVVSWVYDGDTLKLKGHGKVRLLGIDAPEREGSGRDQFYLRQGIESETLRQVSKDALQFVIRHAKGKRVTLTYDRQSHDKHGRLLAYVYLPDGRLLNRMLLEEGLAAVFRKYSFAKKKDFLMVEEQAKESRAGMWRR